MKNLIDQADSEWGQENLQRFYNHPITRKITIISNYYPSINLRCLGGRKKKQLQHGRTRV